MKKMITILAAVVLVFSMSLVSFADTKTTMAERNVLRYIYEIEDEYEEEKEEYEDIFELDTNYEDLGYGIFKVEIIYTFTSDDVVKFIGIYDGVEDDTIRDWIELNGSEIDELEMESIMEEKYPELME